MYILFVCFWLVAYMLMRDEFRTRSDLWMAITISIFGFGSFAMFLNQLLGGEMFPIIRYIEYISMSLVLLFSGISLLVYAMYYTNRMPKQTQHGIAVIGILLIPLIVVINYLLHSGLTTMDDFNFAMYIRTIRFITSATSPYYILFISLLTLNLLGQHTHFWKSEVTRSYLLVAPFSILFYVVTYLLPSLGYIYTWKFNSILITLETILFLLLYIRKNAFGLSYHKKNRTRAKLEKAMLQKTRYVQHAMKNNVQGVIINLQNARYAYENLNNKEEALDDLSRGLEICVQAQRLLERMTLRENPIQIDRQKGTLSQLIENVLGQSQLDIRKKKITVVTDVQTNKIVEYDEVHMTEVFINLIWNALEAVDDDGQGLITISLSDYNRYIRLQVINNGYGIVGKQYSLFGRVNTNVESSKKTDDHGGQGLSYVRKVVALHYGKFKLESSKDGYTVAEVLLPISG